jgi:hypothetical protein
MGRRSRNGSSYAGRTTGQVANLLQVIPRGVQPGGYLPVVSAGKRCHHRGVVQTGPRKMAILAKQGAPALHFTLSQRSRSSSGAGTQ